MVSGGFGVFVVSCRAWPILAFLYYLVFLFGFSRGVRRYLAVSSSFNGGFRSFNDGLCCFLLVLLFLASGVFWRVGGFC